MPSSADVATRWLYIEHPATYILRGRAHHNKPSVWSNLRSFLFTGLCADCCCCTLLIKCCMRVSGHTNQAIIYLLYEYDVVRMSRSRSSCVVCVLWSNNRGNCRSCLLPFNCIGSGSAYILEGCLGSLTPPPAAR